MTIEQLLNEAIKRDDLLPKAAPDENSKMKDGPMNSYRPYKDMPFLDAVHTLKDGIPIKLTEWQGFWFLAKGNVYVFTKDGQILDTPDYETFGIRQDWQAQIEAPILAHFFKTVRVRIDAIMLRIKADVQSSRESSLAYTAAQTGFMFLGLHLGTLGIENPYPKSMDPTSPVIEKHADKANQFNDYLGEKTIIFPDETARVKFLRAQLQDHIDFILAVAKVCPYHEARYWATALDKLIESKLWLGQCLNNIRVSQEETTK